MTVQAQLGRFLIRDINIWDAEGLFALFGDAQTVRYMGLPQIQNVGEAAALIERYKSSPTRWLAVCCGATDQFLGIVGLEIRGHQATVTIAFSRKARGAGREFSVPFVQWIFTHKDIWRVWAYCHVDNVAVQRVLERMGAEREGRLRRFEWFPNVSTTEPQDCYAYAIVRD